MAAFEEHCKDCERIIGDRCENVNRWMDACFKDFGPLHRFARHHWRGVDEAGKLFGDLGRKAAIVHILKDCGQVPKARQWAEQEVDSLGIDPNGKFVGWWEQEHFDITARKVVDSDGR
jgi:hypothetical protein